MVKKVDGIAIDADEFGDGVCGNSCATKKSSKFLTESMID